MQHGSVIKIRTTEVGAAPLEKGPGHARPDCLMYFQAGKDSHSLGSDTVALLRVLLLVAVRQVAARTKEQH